ncbi:MAG: IS630 family transposase [Acidimicrobiia bacterium]|nr:IS630 family transposase [Acidimicrobiia bacterium]
MDKVAARRLRPHEGRKLQRLKRQLSNAVNSRRARVILLSRDGLCNREIAQGVGLSPQWVRRIIHRFNEGGIDAISWYPYFCSRGEPRQFTADIVERIGEVALSPPRQLIGMSVWSLAKLRDYLVEQRIVASISLEWLRQLLRWCGIRWRHTKTWKESNDPEFWPKYRRIRRLYDHKPPGGIRLCVDEFGPLNLVPRHGKHYARTGHVDRLRATYHRTGGVRHFMGVYDLDRDTLTGYFVEKKNRRTFLSFLRWVRRRYRNRGTLHIVLDNATFHSRPEILAYARTNAIRFYWTPTNASWINRIECHFTALEKFTLDNTDYRSHDEMQAAIFAYLAWRNRRRQITMKDWAVYRRRRAA